MTLFPSLPLFHPMLCASCNLKIKSLSVSFLVFGAALFIISVLQTPNLLNCRNLVVSIMILAHFTTKLYHLSKGFFHRGRCVEKSISGQAVTLVYSCLKIQCIYDFTITMCTGRRTRTYLHTSSTKLKPLIVVPSTLCPMYFILSILPELEASALCALSNWAHQAKQSGFGWTHFSSCNNQCENGLNENPFFQVLSHLEIISWCASGRAQSQGGLFQKGRRREASSDSRLNAFSGAESQFQNKPKCLGIPITAEPCFELLERTCVILELYCL